MKEDVNAFDQPVEAGEVKATLVGEVSANPVHFTTDFGNIDDDSGNNIKSQEGGGTEDDDKQKGGKGFENTKTTITNEKVSSTDTEDKGQLANDRADASTRSTAESIAKVNSESDDEKYEDWSEASLMALSKAKSGVWNIDQKDIPKDLGFDELDEISSRIFKSELASYKEEILDQTGRAKEFVDFLLDGGDPQVVKAALSTQDLIELDITAEDNQKKILEIDLLAKDLNKDEVEELIETILDKGKGEDRAKVVQDRMIKQRNFQLEQSKAERASFDAQRKEQHEAYVGNLKGIINSGAIGGYKVNKTTQKKLEEAIFTPTEIHEYINSETGQPQRTRATKIQVMQQELNNDPEKLLGFYLWMLEGGSFDFVKDQADEERDDDIRSFLQGRQTKVSRESRRDSSRGSKSGKNGFEVIANNHGR